MAVEQLIRLAQTFATDPNHHIFALVPPSWIPYVELTRLDQPVGVLMPILLYSIGLTFAACVSQPLISMSEFFVLAWHSDIWLFIMRHALCAFNDAIDYEYDQKVRRHRLRPVARGAITPERALQFSAVQLMLGAWALSNLPTESHGLGVITTIIMMIYPFGKRFTHFPQLIMGSGFTVSIFMACAAVGADASVGSAHYASALFLGVACMLIVAIADTIHAYQDLHDDARAGIKSMTLILGDRPKTWLWTVTAGIEGLLLMVGHQNDFSPFYYLITCGGSFFVLSAMLVLVDLRVAADCRWWFHRGGIGSVFAIVSGLYIEYFIRLCLFG
jgi:4-hydroxybenzoate polyprenyltransferase